MDSIVIKQSLTKAEQKDIVEQLKNVGVKVNLIHKYGDVEWIGYAGRISFDDKTNLHKVTLSYNKAALPLTEKTGSGFTFALMVRPASRNQVWTLNKQLNTKRKKEKLP